MTPERWEQIEELFHRAAECEPGQRTSLLDEACRNDPELLREVDTLLSSDRCAGDQVKTAVREGLNAFTFPLAGKVVSHYRILDGLGGGGMGLVYRAEDMKLGRQVALKFLPEESANDPAALGRFEREARSASALEHPNICPIYEFGEHDGQPFLVMQLLDGQTLRELISAAGAGKPPLPLNGVLDLAIQIAEALEAAHQKGIIHRDIKPANIFITSHGQAKILDFGLAKLARVATAVGDDLESDIRDRGTEASAPHEAAAQTARDLFLSRTGVAMGTAGYMSPEQVRGEKLDARTDLFSFGLVLYEMATGQRAFAGDTGPVLQETILKQLPTPARQLNPKIPAQLEKIIHQALEKDREARYESAAEMRTDLETLRRDIESGHVARWGKLAAVVAILLIISSIFWFATRPPSSFRTLPDLKLRQLTINSAENRVTTGAISPDGKYLAYTDKKGMYIKRIESGLTQTVPLPGTLKQESVDWEIAPYTWFPDSTRFLAQAHPGSEGQGAWSSRTTSIWLVSVQGGAPRKLRENAVAWSVSPDGLMVSFGTNKGRVGDREIWLMGPDGEQARRLYDTGEDSSIGGFIWTADGQRTIYVKTEAGNDGNHDTLLSRDLRGRSPVTLLAPSEMSRTDDLSWLADGRLIYSVREASTVGDTCNYWIRRLDVLTGQTLEKPRRLTNWAGFCMSYTGATADGKRLAFLQSSNRGTVYVADLAADGNRVLKPQHFTLDESSDVVQDWTADSKTLIFTSNRAGAFGIYKQSLKDDSPQPIYTGPVSFGQTRVSPDGKWLIALHWPNPGSLSGPAQVMRVPIGGGPPELVFSALDSGISCARPPSNLCVTAEPTEEHKQATVSAFDPVKGRGPELARFDLDPNSDRWFCEISPDGTRLAIARSGQGPIEIRPLRDQAGQVIRVKGLNNMATLNWAADGKGLFVNSGFKGGTVIYHLDLRGRASVLWENNRGMENIARPSPDGRHLAVQVWPTNSNMWMMENF